MDLFDDFSIVRNSQDTIPIGSPEALSTLRMLAYVGGVVSINEARTKLLGKQPHPDKKIGETMLLSINEDEVYKDFV